MLTIKEIKKNSKISLKNTYWYCVFVHLIFWIVVELTQLLKYTPFYQSPYKELMLLVSSLFDFFFLSIMNVGICYFYINNQNDKPSIKKILYPFKKGRYKKVLGAMAWKYFFLLLWSLIPIFAFGGIQYITFASGQHRYLFGTFHNIASGLLTFLLIPILVAGIVLVISKSIAYGMVPFILADNYSIGYKRALKLSIAMTSYQKNYIFALYMSFIGWYMIVLAAIIIGSYLFSFHVVSRYFGLFLLGTVFILPYLRTSLTELYVILREKAINKK
jgi:uncharacterized membrane protein